MPDKIPQLFTLGWDFEVIEFYPYRSCVLDRMLEKMCDTKDEQKFYEQVQDILIHLFNENSTTKAHSDNKIAFKCITKGGSKFYIGFFDWKLSIGFEIENEGKITKTL